MVELGLVNEELIKKATVKISNESKKSEGKIILHKKDNDTNKILPNVKFKLVSQIKNEKGELIDNPVDTDNIKITDENGEIVFSNLSYGTYKLYEIDAPKPYLLLNPITIIINDSTLINGEYEITLYNNKSITLPFTGSGLNLTYYLIGLLLISLSVTYYNYTKLSKKNKRKNRKEDVK